MGGARGADPAQQMQLQYQLMRAFGRVLGLGWSQTNDNVFTGSPQATLQPGDALAGDASDRHFLRAVYVSVHAAAVYAASGRSFGAGRALFH